MKAIGVGLGKILYPYPLKTRQIYTLWGIFSFFFLSYFYIRLGVFSYYAVTGYLRLQSEFSLDIFNAMFVSFSQSIWMAILIFFSHLFLYLKKFLETKGMYSDFLSLGIGVLLLVASGQTVSFGNKDSFDFPKGKEARYFPHQPEQVISDREIDRSAAQTVKIHESKRVDTQKPKDFGPFEKTGLTFSDSEVAYYDNLQERIDDKIVRAFEKDFQERRLAVQREAKQIEFYIIKKKMVDEKIIQALEFHFQSQKVSKSVNDIKEVEKVRQVAEAQKVKRVSRPLTSEHKEKIDGWKKLAAIYFLNGNCKKAAANFNKIKELIRDRGLELSKIVPDSNELNKKYNCSQ